MLLRIDSILVCKLFEQLAKFNSNFLEQVAKFHLSFDKFQFRFEKITYSTIAAVKEENNNCPVVDCFINKLRKITFSIIIRARVPV